MLNEMHARMNQLLARHGGRIDAVFFCPHAPEDQCDCRKPLPGLMMQIGERYGLELRDVPVVGDSLRDMQAGQAAGCPTHLVLTGKLGLADDDQIAQVLRQVPGTEVHADLSTFAEAIIQRDRDLRGLGVDIDSRLGRLP
jgi:D-glycero-D-manno-heptose 1,7-bisphosphate phosphatase